MYGPELSAVPSFGGPNLEAGHVLRRFDRYVLASADGLIVEIPAQCTTRVDVIRILKLGVFKNFHVLL